LRDFSRGPRPTTLWQICYKISEGNGSLLTNSSEGIGNLSKNTNSVGKRFADFCAPLPEHIELPSEAVERVLINLLVYLHKGCPINKERGNLSAIPLQDLKSKIKTKKQLRVSKTMRNSPPINALSMHTTASSS
jgi:hypothetical protein